MSVLHRSLYRSLLRAARPIDSTSSHRASLITSTFFRSRVPLSWFLSPTIQQQQTCTALIQTHFRTNTQINTNKTKTKQQISTDGISYAFQTLRHLHTVKSTPLTQALSKLQQSIWGTVIQQQQQQQQTNKTSTSTSCLEPSASSIDELSSPNLIMVAAAAQDVNDITRITSLTHQVMNITPSQRTLLCAETYVIHNVMLAVYDLIQTMSMDEIQSSSLPRLVSDLYHVMLSTGVRPDIDTIELLMLLSIYMQQSSTFNDKLCADIHVMNITWTLQLYNNYIYTICYNQQITPTETWNMIQTVIHDMMTNAILPDAATFAMLYQYAYIHHETYTSLLPAVLELASTYKITLQQIIAVIPQYQQDINTQYTTATTTSTDRPTTST